MQTLQGGLDDFQRQAQIIRAVAHEEAKARQYASLRAAIGAQLAALFRNVAHIVCKLALKKCRRIRAADLDQSLVRQIREHGSPVRGLTFLCGIAEMMDAAIFDNGAGVFKKCFPLAIHGYQWFSA